MQIPKGFKINEERTSNYVLKLHRNIYDQKQAVRICNKYLTNILFNKFGFSQSTVDECIFYSVNVVYMLYDDYSILSGKYLKEIERVIEDIKTAKLDITIEGDSKDFLGVNIYCKPDVTIHLNRPHLVDQILDGLKMG